MLKYIVIAAAVAWFAWSAVEPVTGAIADRAAQIELATR